MANPIAALSVPSPVVCQATVIASFEAQRTAGPGGNEWGGSGYTGYVVRVTSNTSGATVAESPVYPVSPTRERYSLTWGFTAPADSVQVSLLGIAGLGYAVGFWNVDMQVELVKR